MASDFSEAFQRPMSFSFIQMADPQFGLFAWSSGLSAAEIEELRQKEIHVRAAPKITGFADETRLYEKAIAEANRLRPQFVAMCGDMVNDADDQAQLDELWRITGQLDDAIPMHWVAGNHDVGNEVTPESLARYRKRFGKDNYLFDHGRSRFIVLNSNVPCDPSRVPEEWEYQLDFLRDALQGARDQDSHNIVVFTHHPLFLNDPDEEDSIFVIPRVRRRVLLDLLTSSQATAVFAGHYHRNCYATVDGLQMVTSGSVGYPLGDDPSGFRTVKVHDGHLEHEYHALDDAHASVKL